MPKLVFSRHGLSEWNKLNQFTGWADVDLAPEGVEEAIEGGRKNQRSRHRIRCCLHICINSCHQNL